jgi:pyrroline-5-carboxylate reductase
MRYELGIIGAGNMAEAIARGVMGKSLLQPEQIIAADLSPQRRELFQSQLKIRAIEDNLEAAGDAAMILLSVKPQHMASALEGIGKVIDPSKTLIISIAAGISTAFIQNHLDSGRPWRVVRTMPNTPMLVGEGMVAIAPGAHATSDDLSGARRLFETAADVIQVPEEHLDAVTALSGSGPAYFFFLVEQMIQAGVELGLPEEQAALLAKKTASGAARMLLCSADIPEVLRRKVTSPGGTTEAAITHLIGRSWPTITIDAIKAAQQRGKELGQ